MEHKNNFGFLRLFFATLVIFSHSAEIIDGNRSREPLTCVFGILTFGELAVYGFFLISGYLIAKSFEQSGSSFEYVEKRIRRIYPGFLVCFAVCVFVLGPFVGSSIRSTGILNTALDALFLRAPRMPAFVGIPYPVLNGSMWTVAYEFRCYLLVIGFGLLGLFRTRWAMPLITVGLLALAEIKFSVWVPRVWVLIMGDPLLMARLLGIFCVGILYYLYRDSIRYNWRLASLSGVLLLICLTQSWFADIAFAIFGGYLIFWVALHVHSPTLQAINGRNDISYGVYLYAWPVQSALVYFFHLRSQIALDLAAIPLIYLLGYGSWKLIESPFVRKALPPRPYDSSGG